MYYIPLISKDNITVNNTYFDTRAKYCEMLVFRCSASEVFDLLGCCDVLMSGYVTYQQLMLWNIPED